MRNIHSVCHHRITSGYIAEKKGKLEKGILARVLARRIPFLHLLATKKGKPFTLSCKSLTRVKGYSSR